MKRLLLAGCLLLLLAGCKTVFVIGVTKDWSVDSNPYHSDVWRPDLKTKAEIRIEKDWKRSVTE